MLYTNSPIHSPYSQGLPRGLDVPFGHVNPKMPQNAAFALPPMDLALPPLITLLEQYSPPSSPTEAKKHTAFMDLPREVRLQIYAWVHRMTPFKQRQLASWYPVPQPGLYISRRVVETNDGGDDSDEDISMPDATQELAESKDDGNISTSAANPGEAVDGGGKAEGNKEDSSLLCPHRPTAYLPSALLLASRDIYHEASALPFETNEFVFINWFSSGLSGAKAFVTRLAPWQKAAIRYVRIEVLAVDLLKNRVVGFCGIWDQCGAQQWVDLCGMLSGLRGLRLMICERVAGSGAGGQGTKVDEPRKDNWVRALASIKGLRNVEVELDIEGWEEKKKVEWCERMAEVVNSVREEEGITGRMEVVCVERLPK